MPGDYGSHPGYRQVVDVSKHKHGLNLPPEESFNFLHMSANELSQAHKAAT
jgi:hypothetical protein